MSLLFPAVEPFHSLAHAKLQRTVSTTSRIDATNPKKTYLVSLPGVVHHVRSNPTPAVPLLLIASRVRHGQPASQPRDYVTAAPAPAPCTPLLRQQPPKQAGRACQGTAAAHLSRGTSSAPGRAAWTTMTAAFGFGHSDGRASSITKGRDRAPTSSRLASPNNYENEKSNDPVSDHNTGS